jgi:hypothetical protein
LCHDQHGVSCSGVAMVGAPLTRNRTGVGGSSQVNSSTPCNKSCESKMWLGRIRQQCVTSGSLRGIATTL